MILPLCLVSSSTADVPQDAQVNTLTSRLPAASHKVFYVQSCFGLGATIAPFISTAFAQHVPDRAYLYYLVAVGVALGTAVVLVLVFETRTEEQIVGHLDETRQLQAEGVSHDSGEKVAGGSEGQHLHGPSRKEDVVDQAIVPPTSGAVV